MLIDGDVRSPRCRSARAPHWGIASGMAFFNTNRLAQSVDMNRALRERPSGPPAKSVRGRPEGIGRGSSAAAERVSDDLRRHCGSYLDDRRSAALLSMMAMGSLGVVTAYQFGLIRKVPELPLPRLDATAVDASGAAYQRFKTPDGALGLLSQAVTLALIGSGPASRSSDQPWLPLVGAAKAVIDAGSAAYLGVEQQSKHGRFCSWCLAAAVANVAVLRYVFPEALASLKRLRAGA